MCSWKEEVDVVAVELKDWGERYCCWYEWRWWEGEFSPSLPEQYPDSGSS